MSCDECSFHAPVPGSYHIACKWHSTIRLRAIATVRDAPPFGSDKRKEMTAAFLDELKKNKIEGVLRVQWHGSGVFPYYYDPGTILACSTFMKGSPVDLGPIDTLAAFVAQRGDLMDVKRDG